MTDDEDGDGTLPIFEPGDAVYGADPFKGTESARPWLIISNDEGKPFHGEQYIALTLTTKTWLDELIDAPEACWIRGGTPDESRIVPWSVQSLDRDDLGHWQGRIEDDLLREAIDALIDHITYEVGT